MAFTYSGDPASSSRNAVRFLIQDTDSTDVLLQDAEIDWVISEAGSSVYQAAHDACYAIASQFARLADSTSKSVGDVSLSESYSARSQRYFDLAEKFLELAAKREPPLPWANAESLKATADRLETTHNTDYYLGIHDYPGR
jgi:hypothetical protein